MLKHPSGSELERYAARTLAADELLGVDEHLSDCEECRSMVAGRPKMISMAATLAQVLAEEADENHLNYEQLAAYVDGNLDPVGREIAEVHAKVCELCSLQLSDLKKMKEALPRAIPMLLPAGNQTEGGLLEHLKAVFSLKWAVPALAAILLGIGAWALFFSSPRLPVSNVAVTQQTPGTAVNGTEPSSGDQTVAGLTNTNSANAEVPPPKPEVLLADGSSRIGIDETGNIIGINAGEFGPQIKSVLTGGDIHISQDAVKLRSGTGVLMGGGDSVIPFKLTTPVGKVVIADRPQFKWGPVAGAESYLVTVYDDDFNKVASSPPLKVTSWTSSRSLRRGGIYNWQVTAAEGRAGDQIARATRTRRKVQDPRCIVSQ